MFNIGSSTEIPIVELARRVIDHTGSASQIEFVSYDDAYDVGFEELGRRKPDTTAIRQLIGWTPQLSVDDAIRDVVAFERRRREGAPVAA